LKALCVVCVRISFASLIFTKNVVEVWGRPQKVDFVGKNAALQHANWCIATRELVHCGERIGALRRENWCIATRELVRRTTENPWGLLHRITEAGSR